MINLIITLSWFLVRRKHCSENTYILILDKRKPRNYCCEVSVAPLVELEPMPTRLTAECLSTSNNNYY